MNITRENIDELNAVVKVDIAKEDYSSKVEKVLKDYRKNANIPGFRKGHVPMGMVKKQYGKAVLVDEVNKLLQDALNKYLTEEKLDVLGNPLPKEQENFDWDSETYTFEFELGLSPQFEVSLDNKEPITHYKIVAGDEMIENQVKTIQKQYGKLVSKETAEEGDQVTGTFKNEEEGIDARATLPLDKIKGKKNKDKFIGAKAGDVIKLKTKGLFEDEHDLMEFLQVEHDKAHDLDVEVEFTVSEVNQQELADLDQELFDKLFGKGEVTSVTELKEKIKEDAAKQFEQQSDQQLLNDVTEMLIENTSFDLPKEFLQKWIQTAGEKELSAEEAKEEYEKSEKGLRFQLIEGKLIAEHDLQVKFEDLKAFAKERIKEQMAQFGQMNPDDKELDDIAARILSRQDEVKRLSEQLMNQKLLELYKEKVNLKEKEVTYEEFVKEVYQ
ncbi:trigger factor [Salinimicrobium catena]|uniref:Trigger factor n=1 Tax=Salinimicrobium catena TaxID=390640 RepID=A0A1H5H297_9FLAO|nr:trigger factor [Salinimicrobium catena]SDK67176.1 trigger factor [Salinimicrobium catena]SEE21874.1 trigger factor [Salinimicrobium catena]